MSKDKVPLKIVVPIIVVTWVLSLISALAIVSIMPSLFPVRTEQIGAGLITSDKIADGAIITLKLADGNVTSAKILNGNITAADLADSSIITVKFADGSVTTAKLADGNVTTDKIADGNVTNTKLAAYAIPFNASQGTNAYNKNTAIWENVTAMSVQITMERNSTLLIMFSAETRINILQNVRFQALVDGSTALPGLVYAQPPGWPGWYSTISYNFYLQNVGPGQHTVYIQWYVYGGATATMYHRTLLVIALPE